MTYAGRIAACLTVFFMMPSGEQSRAEPVHLQHANGEGSGFTFRRGNMCAAITADHVVRQGELPVMSVTVLDRTGASASGSVAFANSAYDLALVVLPEETEVACSQSWPTSVSVSPAAFTGSTRFEAVRHYPDGRETLILLTYAGSTQNELSLAPVDRTRIRESDSGSIVMADGQPVGIVLRVRPEDDRVDVLRFDVIDQLVGERFRGASRDSLLAFTGAFRSNNRRDNNWTTYARSWLIDLDAWRIVDADDPGAQCTVRVQIASWTRRNQPNEDHANAVEDASLVCGRRGTLSEQLCRVATRRVEGIPRTLTQHEMMIEVTATPATGAPATGFGTVGYAHDPADRGAEADRMALRHAMSEVAGPLLESGQCG